MLNSRPNPTAVTGEKAELIDAIMALIELAPDAAINRAAKAIHDLEAKDVRFYRSMIGSTLVADIINCIGDEDAARRPIEDWDGTSDGSPAGAA